MSNFFNDLATEGIIKNCAELLDWIFDDERFSSGRGWTSGYVGKFTKKVKKTLPVRKSNYSYDCIKNLSFPHGKPKSIKIIHAKGDSEARDFVRHIRNGIAHGKTNISKPKGELYIEILDYNKSGEQTAYIYIPLSCIFNIYNTYSEVEKSINNSIKKGRKR